MVVQVQGQYKQFVTNRVAKIRRGEGIEWRHVPTTENPADLGSRGGQLTTLWLKGPIWLSNRSNWPPHLVVKLSVDSQSESKATQEILNTSMEDEQSTILEVVLKKYPLAKT